MVIFCETHCSRVLKFKTSTVTALLARLTACKEELSDIRGQHSDLSREADSTRVKLDQALVEVKADNENLLKEKEALNNNCTTLKP